MPPQPRMFIRTTFQPPPGPAAGSNHILRFAGSLQPVHDDQRQPLLPLRLPVAVAQNPHLRLDLEEPFLGLRAVRWRASGSFLQSSGHGHRAKSGAAQTRWQPAQSGRAMISGLDMRIGGPVAPV